MLTLGAACPSTGDDDGAAAGGTSDTGGDATGTTVAATGSSDGADGSSSGGGDESSSGEPVDLDPVQMTLLEDVVFYDGYAETVDEPVPEGVTRLSNALYTTKMTEEELGQIQGTLAMQVTTGALCDNYDRIGSVQLAIVPKGQETYDPARVDRLEIARFITPFMDMNRQPDRVPYEFNLDNIIPILTDDALLAEYDIWFELSVFGVPYAANNEIAGCDGRNDVTRGWLLLYTDSTEPAPEFNTYVPLAVSESFNNYGEGASDAVGTTTKTIPFSLDADSEATQLVLITSNHGANTGGEEYNRREHFVYVDRDVVLSYVPGRDSCEPFRMYNTQGNGIYGASPKSDEEWQSFSNWCPGDRIDTRVIDLGPMSAGDHTFVIDVPDAVFANGEGNIPVSLYLQARL